MSIVLLALLYAVTMRAFLFEIKFGTIREKIASKHDLLDTFLSCSFCNGFWTGLFTYLILVWHPTFVSDLFTAHLIHCLYFAVASGVIGWLQRSYTSQWDFN